jgi:hypothetical protein
VMASRGWSCFAGYALRFGCVLNLRFCLLQGRYHLPVMEHGVSFYTQDRGCLVVREAGREVSRGLFDNCLDRASLFHLKLG